MMDFSAIKKLTIGGVELKQLFINGIQIWKSGYKNWVFFSTEADGKTIYNGIGYKKGYRVRSGGTESANASSICTGFIPVNGGDVVRVYGWDRATSTTYDTINAYDANFNSLGQLGYGNYGIFTINGSATHYNGSTMETDASGISSWVVPPSSIGVAYIRVTATNSGLSAESFIVTRNEEIT